MSARRWTLWIGFAAWSAFAIWCAAGFPPAVDLPAHAAEIETLKNILRGDPAVREVYNWKLTPGYGLALWLGVPLAWFWNGAVAARILWGLSIALYPLSLLALARAFKRSDAIVIFGLPLCFNMTYWYGYLPNFFAQPLAWFTLSLFIRTLQNPRPAKLLALNVLALAVFQAHVLTFVVLGVALCAVAFGSETPALWERLKISAWGLAFPALVASARIATLAGRSVTSGPVPNEYGALSHLNWFTKNYRPEGQLAIAVPVLVGVALFATWVFRARREPRAPIACFAAIGGLYLITPKTLAGIYLVAVRIPALAAVPLLFVVDWSALWRPLRWGLVALCGVSIAEAAVFHFRFARAVDGLSEMIALTEPGRHGYYSSVGPKILGSKHLYLEHLGQWLTATRGGVGHNFFADAEHQAVTFRPGERIPSYLASATPEELARFDRVLVFGGGPLPPSLSAWPETLKVGPWRRLDRPNRGP